MTEQAAKATQGAMREPYRPRPPFLGWPRQWTLRGAAAWLTPHGPAVCVQTTVNVATPELANDIHDLFAWLARAEVQRQFPNFVIVHDWRSIERIGDGARVAWMARAQDYGDVYMNVDSYMALSAHPVVRMALSTAALALQVATGHRKTTVVREPDGVLTERGVRAPAPGFLELFSQERGLEAFESRRCPAA